MLPTLRFARLISARAVRAVTSTRNHILLATAILLAGSCAWSEGGLLVFPKRIIFQGHQRTAEVNLVNASDGPLTYRVSFVHERMSASGDMKAEDAAAQAGEQFADDLVRFTPRQVTLAAHESQTIRLQLRKPEVLADGEYRSHLLLRAIPSEAPAQPGAAARTAAGVNIQLRLVYGLTIPVIVRQGETSAQVTISNLQIEAKPGGKDAPVVTFQLDRAGNRSVYGDCIATFAPTNGKEARVGIASGLAVYTPNPLRTVSIQLAAVPAGWPAGHLTVNYKEKAEDGGAVLATASVQAHN